MAITHIEPHWRLIAVPFAVVAALAATLLALAGPEVARAHGSCGNIKTKPEKTSGGRIKGTSYYDCTSSHDGVLGCVQIVREQGNDFVAASDPKCMTASSAQRSPTATRRAACSQSGWYRTAGYGAAQNGSGSITHESIDYSARVWITCSTADLTNTGGVFEDIGDLLK